MAVQSALGALAARLAAPRFDAKVAARLGDAQGSLFSMPMSEAEILSRLAAHARPAAA